MGGIAGVIGRTRPKEAEVIVEQMLLTMGSLPVDKRSVYVNEGLGLCVGWVVHPNSFTDCMPVQSMDGRTTIVLSGEVFCPEERLQSLRGTGHRFSDSDASHLSSLYEELGEDFFAALNGTFCGVLANTQTGKIQLFNDRMGFERLYFSEDPDRELFYFVSEAKALLKVVPRLRQFDPQGLAQFLNFGFTFHETTLYKGVSLLPPASIWEFVTKTPVRKKTYFRPEDWQVDPSIGPAEFQERFNETFRRILPRYFSGNLRPGVSLTGGWDTRMIMASHHADPGSIPCYTFAGLTGETVDVIQARKVASVLRQKHQVLRLHSDFLSNFAEHAERTVFLSDGNGDVCLSHEIYLNRLAREVAGARITGNFGSEVLRGMSTFKENLPRSKWAEGELKTEVESCREQWSRSNKGDAAHFAVFKEIPWKLSTTFRLANSQLPTRAPFLDNEILRLACICPLSTRRESAFHISFVRSENPDLLKIPTDRGEGGEDSQLNRVIRRVLYSGTFKVDYTLNEGMPNHLSFVLDPMKLERALVFRHKYLEYRRWFRGPLRGYLESILNNGNSFVSGIVGRQSVERVLKDHASGKRNQFEQLNVWLTLELINKNLLRAS